MPSNLLCTSSEISLVSEDVRTIADTHAPDLFAGVMGATRGREYPEFSDERVCQALETAQRLGNEVWDLEAYYITHLQHVVREAAAKELPASEMQERCLYIRPLPLGYVDPSDTVEHTNVFHLFDVFGQDFTLKHILGGLLRTGECTFERESDGMDCSVQCYNSVKAYQPVAVGLLHAPKLFRLQR